MHIYIYIYIYISKAPHEVESCAGVSEINSQTNKLNECEHAVRC